MRAMEFLDPGAFTFIYSAKPAEHWPNLAYRGRFTF